MPRLILHIGGGKTGSSFLQHCFASKAEALREAGVLYPHADSAPAAVAGAVTSGNGVELARFLSSETASSEHSTLDSLADVLSSADAKDVLFSCENMQAFRPRNLEILAARAGASGYELAVVYYVRSVVGRAYSAYVQRVKRHLERREFKQFVRTYQYPCARVATNLSRVLPSTGYLVRNYDHAKSDLFGHFARAALPPAAQAIQIDGRVVNRTLAPPEVAFMLKMNSLLATEAQSAFVGRCIMNSHSKLTPIVVSPEEFEILAEKNAEKIPVLNKFLPAEEQVDMLGPHDAIGDRQSSAMTPTETAIVSVLAELVRGKVPARR